MLIHDVSWVSKNVLKQSELGVCCSSASHPGNAPNPAAIKGFVPQYAQSLLTSRIGQQPCMWQMQRTSMLTIRAQDLALPASDTCALQVGQGA